MAALASTAPDLGKAKSFAVLAGTTVTNTGLTVITGDLGVSPGTAVTGMTGPPDGTLHGSQHTGTDALAVSAKNDLTTAYLAAKSSPCNFNE
ncbi:MAG TPA: ice-binding family protein, partial [Candidatus Acidoferrum sp.]|nr:ice-binding family protein [Candidatus Acidoferrum sp.]